MKTKFLALLFGLALLALCSGCHSLVKYAPSPPVAWGPDVRVLGTVTANSGRWPLALNAPPPEYTCYAALRAKAAKQFGVPPDEIMLGEVTVRIGSEIVGTVRDWKASALAGQKKPVSVTDKSPADQLLELKKLLDAGIITQAEYDIKKKPLIDRL
jgi:hypothetical protein